ncbi:MAG: Crp/Fnr family transcriptional regulator [Devosiaceae bacterium]|nr:Crp/Fnr family transcriptional regulator [Devosiaceae bacterium]
MIPIDRNLLKEFALFATMSTDDLDNILSGSTSRLLGRNEVVFKQGDMAHSFYILLHGRLKVSQVTADGQQIIVRIINPGDLFGIAKALKRDSYPATAKTVSESLILCWPTNLWDQLMKEHPALSTNALQTVGARLQEAHTRIRELATENVEQRVAHTILRLVRQSGKRVEQGVNIDFPVSRKDIAEMSGTTLHTVSRILSAWESAELVQSGRKKILVRQPHRLLLLADGIIEGCA